MAFSNGFWAKNHALPHYFFQKLTAANWKAIAKKCVSLQL
jgi:hypothetical protein